MAECGNCTKCCELLFIPEIDKKEYEVCEYCTVGKGCNIYGEHPKACKDFYCCYAQMEKVDVGLRPDNCQMIFERLDNSDIFIGMQDIKFKPTKAAVKQIEEFKRQGFSIVVFPDKDKKIIIPKEGMTEQEVLEEFEKKVREFQKKKERIWMGMCMLRLEWMISSVS